MTKTIYPKSEKDLGNSSDGKRPSLIEQACINIHLFPNGSWDKIISDKLMQEALRLCIQEILPSVRDSWTERKIIEMIKREGIE